MAKDGKWLCLWCYSSSTKKRNQAKETENGWTINNNRNQQTTRQLKKLPPAISILWTIRWRLCDLDRSIETHRRLWYGRTSFRLLSSWLIRITESESKPSDSGRLWCLWISFKIVECWLALENSSILPMTVHTIFVECGRLLWWLCCWCLLISVFGFAVLFLFLSTLCIHFSLHKLHDPNKKLIGILLFLFLS